MENYHISTVLNSYDRHMPPYEHLPQDIKYSLITDDPNIDDPNKIILGKHTIKNISDQLLPKYVKCLGWKHLPKTTDKILYTDGSIRVKNKNFYDVVFSHLQTYDMVFIKHPQLKTTVEEVKNAEKHKKYDIVYIRDNYKRLEKDIGTQIIPLICSGVIGYNNSQKVQNFMNDWFLDIVLNNCLLCQLNLPYILQKHNINVHILDFDIWKNDYIWVELHRHEQPFDERFNL